MMRVINADALVDVQMYDEEHEEWSVETMTVEECLARFADTPTIIEMDRPHGEWSVDSINEIELSYGGIAYEPVYKCSYCGRITESYVRFDKPIMPEDADFPNYCGWCGARMKGADNETD